MKIVVQLVVVAIVNKNTVVYTIILRTYLQKQLITILYMTSLILT